MTKKTSAKFFDYPHVGHCSFFFANHQLTEIVIWREFGDGGFFENVGVGERYRLIPRCCTLKQLAIPDFNWDIGSIACS